MAVPDVRAPAPVAQPAIVVAAPPAAPVAKPAQQTPPPVVVSAEADYLSGVARWNSRLIILLDLDKVLLLNA